MSSTTSDILVTDEPGQRRDIREPEKEWTALDWLLLFARKRRFIFSFTAATLILTAIVTLVLPKRYTATTALLPPQQSSMSSALLSQIGGGSLSSLSSLASGGLGIKNPSEIYIAMIRSRTVEDAMVNRFNLMKEYHAKRMSDARKALERHTDAVTGTKDGVIRLSIEASSPELSANMTNAYVEEVRKLAATLAVTEAGQRRLFFEQQLEGAKNKLADAEEDLKKTEMMTGMLQPDSQSKALIEAAARVQGQITATQVQLQAVMSYGTEDNPTVIMLKNQLAALRSELQKLTGSSGSETDLFVPKGKIPEAAIGYVRKFREVKYHEVVFELVARQYEMARLDEAKQGSVIQVIDPAVVPDKRSFPKRTIITVVMTMFGFLLACFIVFLRHKYDLMADDAENRQKLTELRNSLRWRRT